MEFAVTRLGRESESVNSVVYMEDNAPVCLARHGLPCIDPPLFPPHSHLPARLMVPLLTAVTDMSIFHCLKRDFMQLYIKHYMCKTNSHVNA